MCIIIDCTAVKILASKFLVVMEILTKQCWGSIFWSPGTFQSKCTGLRLLHMYNIVKTDFETISDVFSLKIAVLYTNSSKIRPR